MDRYHQYYKFAISTTGYAEAPTMLNYNPLHCLPSAKDLPDSDYTPVDNELQDLIPSLLKAILAWLWTSRMDWFFGVDMGIYSKGLGTRDWGMGEKPFCV
ncbi:MAG: hypothetical protein V7K21_20960 [Nostoc sp.]|uniref:hypothetical protein n=1 Tax=Nostoc sp. TaxID=1180 RepID=UPI002FF67A28